MDDQAPGQQQARVYLDGLIRELADRSDARLPTIKAMAAAADVAVVTMWKAVRRLRAAGVLRASRRAGIVLAPQGSSAQPGAAATRATELPPAGGVRAVAARLSHDILRGVFRDSETLPSLKELSQRYGACYRTVKAAAVTLAQAGHLEPHRRGFRPPAFHGPRAGGTIALIARTYSATGPIYYNRITQEYLLALESECARTGVGLTVVPCWYGERGAEVSPLLEAACSGAQRLAVLGVVLWAAGIDSALLEQRIIPALTRLGKPIAWLDESGAVDAPPVAARHRQITVFSMPRNIELARQVGHYLLNLGHERIVYICPYHRVDWSQDRLAGLREIYRQAGHTDGVREVSVAGLDRSTVAGLAPRPELPPAAPRREGHRVPDSRTYFVNSRADEVAERAALAVTMQGLLRRASAVRGATAWVAGNDAVAIECVDYLRGRRVRIPADISVLGFDDTLEASFQRLTSYNFSRASAVHAMFSYIMSPAWRAEARGGRRRIRIDGFVHERESTGTPGKSGMME